MQKLHYAVVFHCDVTLLLSTFNVVFHVVFAQRGWDLMSGSMTLRVTAMCWLICIEL